MPETNFFFEEKSIKAFVDYKNIFATKLKVKSSIGKDIFAFKIHKESSIYENVFLHKNIKEVWINPDIHTFKKDGEVTLNINIQAVKNINQADINSMVSFLPKLKDVDINSIVSFLPKLKDVHINIDEWLKKEKPHMNILDMIFAEKPGKTCYYDYGEWVKKEDLSLYLETQEAIIKSKAPMSVIDCCVPAIRELEGFYDYGVFAEKNLECDIFHQMKALEITKHVMLNPESCKNWGWIYEDPDPFQGDAFGIDELLLPERDTRYADFIDIIFDKENMVPRNPISQINDTTFVGKYPTRHPIPEYEDIGIVYLDVRTSIMHDIFLEYYKIWQSKIFEFGAMNMVQSSKLMLEYIYSWIMTTYHNEPDDPKLSEALRVFRQIRWYTERAIIQNAQYIISYEMAPLESKLTTGTCASPNDLDTNYSMFIDSQKGVIKPNPLYFGTQSAHVSFTIENLKDTSFSFSLSNNTGSVKIYLNGALIDTVYHSGSLIYGIPYTGTENTIKIEKSAADNINAAFYIGYIKVPDMSFKDLKVEFDPTLRAGNRPINEVAQKMIAYANNHDDVQKAYEEIRKANLGVSETYKKMLDYWHLHHQNKTKGKRLTIKEV